MYMTHTNPDNPQNIRTIDTFDSISIAGDVRQDTLYLNFMTQDTSASQESTGGTLEGSLVIKDFEQLKNLTSLLVQAVDELDKKIAQ